MLQPIQIWPDMIAVDPWRALRHLERVGCAKHRRTYGPLQDRSPLRQAPLAVEMKQHMMRPQCQPQRSTTTQRSWTYSPIVQRSNMLLKKMLKPPTKTVKQRKMLKQHSRRSA